MNTKQVIVIRKDLNMRKGKMCAQAAHASMSFLTRRMAKGSASMELSDEEDSWLDTSFRKICVYVNSEQELRDVMDSAFAEGLIVHEIVDNGATEFAGVPTLTCIAIGPHWEDRFDPVTGHLPLL